MFIVPLRNIFKQFIFSRYLSMPFKMIHTLGEQSRHSLKVNLLADRGPSHMEVAD